MKKIIFILLLISMVMMLATAYASINVPESEAGIEKTITLPKGLLEIADDAFDGDAGFTIVGEENSIASEYARRNHFKWQLIPENLENVFKLPEALKTIEPEAFQGTNAEFVLLPEGVNQIDERAFSEMRRLIAINIPNSVLALAENAIDTTHQALIIANSNGIGREYAAANHMPFIPTDAYLPAELHQRTVEKVAYRDSCDALPEIIKDTEADASVNSQRYCPMLTARRTDRPELNYQYGLKP